MNFITKLGIVLSLILLTGASCATTEPLLLKPGQIIISGVDSSLLEECPLPTNLPTGRRLTQAEIEKYWGTDRKNLVVCRTRHGFLGDAIVFRDGKITGISPSE